MANEDMREVALETALRIAGLFRCRHACEDPTDDILQDAEKIFQWLGQGPPVELILNVGPVTEQT
jgi:hypothetical protein